MKVWLKDTLSEYEEYDGSEEFEEEIEEWYDEELEEELDYIRNGEKP